MQTIEIIKKINETLLYLQARKDSLFNQMQKLHQQLDAIAGDISEQETYLELEKSREKLESNIFSLYDTTDIHTKEKEHLSNALKENTTRKLQLEEALAGVIKEMDVVNSNIVSNQILVKLFSEMDENADYGKKMEDKSDITSRLELCIGILELDKERCFMELKKLLDDIKTMY